MKGVVNHQQEHTVTVTRAVLSSNVTIVLEIDGHFGAELQECQGGKVSEKQDLFICHQIGCKYYTTHTIT